MAPVRLPLALVALVALAPSAFGTHPPAIVAEPRGVLEQGAVDGPVAVRFQGHYVADHGEAVTNVTWDFGDGSVAYGLRTEKSWRDAGRYTVRLTVHVETRGNASTRTAEVGITVSNPGPTHEHAVPTFATGVPLRLVFDAWDNREVASVVLFYRHAGEPWFRTMNLTHEAPSPGARAGASRWVGTLPAELVTSAIEYSAQARDVSTRPAVAEFRPAPGEPYYFGPTPENVTRDVAAPTILIEGADSPTTNPRPTLTIRFSDAGAGVDPATAVISFEGRTFPANATVLGLAFTPGADLRPGLHPILVRVRDLVGNEGNATAVIVVKAPDAARGAPAPGTGAAIAVVAAAAARRVRRAITA